jgi:hypothetical protein
MNYDPVILGIFFCDSVIQEAGTGKHSLIGCFNQWNSNRFPFNVPPFYAFISFTNIKGKFEKPLNVTVRIEDPNSGLVLSNVSALLGATNPDYQFLGFEVVQMPILLMPFPIYAPGAFSLVVLLNNEKIGHRDLIVSSVTIDRPNFPLPPLPQPPSN